MTVAMSASLLVMVCNLTIGRKRYADVQADAEAIAARAGYLRDRALSLAHQDEEAYGRVSATMKLPRGSDEERETRHAQLQAALKEAAAPPLEMMRVAAEVLELALELAPIGNRAAVSDVGCAGYLAAAGYGAAKLNVEINLSAVTDQVWAADMRKALLETGPVEDLASRLQQAVAMVMSA